MAELRREMEPLVTVVIPTVRRPALLRRAVESALAGLPPGDVEVIVVPNGPDAEREAATLGLSNCRGVYVSPTFRPGANAARNHGLAAARGRYVRFLDDDDVLYPVGAQRQYAEMEKLGADVCSGAFDAVDSTMEVLYTLRQRDCTDLVVAVLGRHGMWQPTAHVFRREAVADIRWDEQLPYCQDFDWMLKVCTAREQRWLRCDWTIGAWHRHLGSRISLEAGPDPKRKVIAQRVLEVVDELNRKGHLTDERRTAAAECLWNGVHAALCYSPIYWTSIARRARVLSPESHPQIPRYTHAGRFTWTPDPLLWEWLMLPKRRLSYWFEHLRIAVGLARYG